MLINKPAKPINIIKFAFGDFHTLVLFSCDDKYYLAGCGSNENGQLGIDWSIFEDIKAKYISWKIIEIEKLIGNQSQFWNKFEYKIKDIAAGPNYSLILVEFLPAKTQHIYRFQFNQEDEYAFISRKDDPLYKRNPVQEEQFPFKKDINRIICYNERIMVLMTDNSLYIKGVLYNMSFSLNKYKLYAKFLVKITDIVIGINHTLLVAENDIIYCLGHNEYSEFGMSNDRKFGLVTEQTFFKDNKLVIDKISSGGRHTLVLCQEGKVYCFGDNSDHQCCDYDKVVLIPTLVKFDNNNPIVDICCGFNSSFARNNKGIVYGWGNNSESKLGIEENRTRPKRPIEITVLRTRNVYGMYAGKHESVFFIKMFEEKNSLFDETEFISPMI